MQVAVHNQSLLLSAGGRDYASDRMAAALARAEGHVRGVRVYLADQNGPRGGADKTCTVTVALAVGRPVTVVERAPTAAGAVAGAADRAGQAVHRAVERRRRAARRAGRLVRLVKRLLGRGKDGGR